jgi:hypothetical protein
MVVRRAPVKTVQICLDEKTKSDLWAAAVEQDRSASSIVRAALRSWLAKPARDRRAQQDEAA